MKPKLKPKCSKTARSCLRIAKEFRDSGNRRLMRFYAAVWRRWR